MQFYTKVVNLVPVLDSICFLFEMLRKISTALKVMHTKNICLFFYKWPCFRVGSGAGSRKNHSGAGYPTHLQYIGTGVYLV
jgi:hypothetical protein